MMFPMAEMAGEKRIKYVDQVQYIYNDLNPINDFKVYGKEQLAVDRLIRKMPITDNTLTTLRTENIKSFKSLAKFYVIKKIDAKEEDVKPSK